MMTATSALPLSTSARAASGVATCVMARRSASPGLLSTPVSMEPAAGVPAPAPLSRSTTTVFTAGMLKLPPPPKAAPKAVASMSGANSIIASPATLR